MANCDVTLVSNGFRVKDAEAFRKFMATAVGGESPVELMEYEGKDGQTAFYFGCYGGIEGIAGGSDEDLDESSYDDFVAGLKAHVADDDAIIIVEVANERLRYVSGVATVVTSSDIRYIDLRYQAIEAARDMLQNPNWNTEV